MTAGIGNPRMSWRDSIGASPRQQPVSRLPSSRLARSDVVTFANSKERVIDTVSELEGGA
jgi:hypothetical protein